MPDAPEFINPNLHVILVHYPIGLLVLGMFIECFAWLGWRRSGFRAAGRWMIFLGVLSAIPTAFAGLYALADVARMGLSADDAASAWRDLLTISPLVHADGGAAWEMARNHAIINSVTAGVMTVVVVAWVGASDVWRRRLYWPCLLALLLGLAGVAVGAWHGGEMVYRHGVGVEQGESLLALAAPASGEDVFALQTGEPETPTPAAPASPAPAPPPAPDQPAPDQQTPDQPTPPVPATAATAATSPEAAGEAGATEPAEEMPVAALGRVQPAPSDPTAPPRVAPATGASATTLPATAPAPATIVVEVETPAPPMEPAPPQLREPDADRDIVILPPTPAPATPATAPALSATDAAPATTQVTRSGQGIDDAPAPPAGEIPNENLAAAEQTDYELVRSIQRYLPPLQTHVILAGTAVAVAMAALALSLRAANTVPEIQLEPRAELTDLAAAYGARPVPGAQLTPHRPSDADPPIALGDELSDVDMAAVKVSVVERHARIPSARFWLLTFLIAALASLAGWWVLGSETFEGERWDVERLVRMVFNEDWEEEKRRPLHVVTGGAIIFLPLILAMLAAWAPRRKGVLLFFSFFLILAVAVQVWLGILLLWDTPLGPVMSFNEATVTMTPDVAVGE